MDKFENLRHQASYLLNSLEKSQIHENAFQATIHFPGYVSVYSTVTDLIKLCTIAMHAEEPLVSPIVGGKIDIANIMELALQLMPRDEPEFLEEALAAFNTEDDVEELPMYNYSSVVVLRSA